MHLAEAVDTNSRETGPHGLSARKSLLETILKQIAKQDGFDGHYDDTSLEVIRHFVRQLDNETTLSFWRQTRTTFDRLTTQCAFQTQGYSSPVVKSQSLTSPRSV